MACQRWRIWAQIETYFKQYKERNFGRIDILLTIAAAKSLFWAHLDTDLAA